MDKVAPRKNLRIRLSVVLDKISRYTDLNIANEAGT